MGTSFHTFSNLDELLVFISVASRSPYYLASVHTFCTFCSSGGSKATVRDTETTEAECDILGVSKMRETLDNLQQQLSEYSETRNPIHTGASMRKARLAATDATLELLGLESTSMADITANLQEAIESEEKDLARLEKEFADIAKTKGDHCVYH